MYCQKKDSAKQKQDFCFLAFYNFKNENEVEEVKT